MPIERHRELRRRRHRKKKLGILKRKLDAGTVSDKQTVAVKLRKLTPGAEVLIERWQLP